MKQLYYFLRNIKQLDMRIKESIECLLYFFIKGTPCGLQLYIIHFSTTALLSAR